MEKQEGMKQKSRQKKHERQLPWGQTPSFVLDWNSMTPLLLYPMLNSSHDSHPANSRLHLQTTGSPSVSTDPFVVTPYRRSLN